MFYGQCSELCGVNHLAMPILVIGIFNDIFNLNLSDISLNNNDNCINKDSFLFNFLWFKYLINKFI
jgi:heme/copper-type cytochrome/quinol oxidase subunit 2